jgi:hypothetical protein
MYVQTPSISYLAYDETYAFGLPPLYVEKKYDPDLYKNIAKVLSPTPLLSNF